MERASKVGLVYLFSGTAGQLDSMERFRSFSTFLASFFSRFSFSLVSWMTCCAAVRGSFVGVRRVLAADHQEEMGLSRCERVGEGVSNEGIDCERAGDICLGVVCVVFSIERTFSSMR